MWYGLHTLPFATFQALIYTIDVYRILHLNFKVKFNKKIIWLLWNLKVLNAVELSIMNTKLKHFRHIVGLKFEFVYLLLSFVNPYEL